MATALPLQSPARRSLTARIGRLLDAAIPFRRVQLAAVVVLTLLGAAAELVTIGAVLPLLALAASPGKAQHLPLVGALLGAIGSALHVGPVSAAAVMLALAAIGATAVRFALTWASLKFSAGLQQDLSLAVFARALRQPYAWYLKQNSSALIAAQEQIGIVVASVVNPVLASASSAVMALVMGAFLFVLDPGAALVAALTIGGTYAIISVVARRRASAMSSDFASAYEARVRTLQETMGGIRDINLDRSERVFEQRLWRIEDGFRRLVIVAGVITVAPRLLIEGVAIVLVATLALWFSLRPDGLVGAIPVLGALALGAQRMLPMIQQIYVGLSNLAIYGGSIDRVVALLDTPADPSSAIEPPAEPAPFRATIALDGVDFTYSAGRPALAGIDLAIRKGERIGLIGRTGSGKSTLVDLLMGLLPPTHGRLLIDGQPLDPAGLANWKAQIAHVPQAIFLADDSIAANIAFGQPAEAIDRDRVRRAADDAGLADFLDALADGLDTSVGERGVRLSGGQRQRIGIARALYKRATVLVLDEATSALDDETEAAVMQSVDRLGGDLTILMIAHRLTTLAGCDRVIRLAGGRIEGEGSYAAMRGKAG